MEDKTGWFPSNYVKESKGKLFENTARVVILLFLDSTPTSPVLTTAAQQKQYRAVVLKDLIDSEKAHVTEQQGLVTNFLHPLEKSAM